MRIITEAFLRNETITRFSALPSQNIDAIVGIINTEWRNRGNAYDLLPKETLDFCLAKSPAYLQRDIGHLLTFRAALSEGITQEKGYLAQEKELKQRKMSVADPASTAVVLAACMVAAETEKKSDFTKHLRDASFRTQQFDPVPEKPLTGRTMRIGFEPGRGLVAIEEGRDSRGRLSDQEHPNIWCAGTELRSSAPGLGKRLWIALFG